MQILFYKGWWISKQICLPANTLYVRNKNKTKVQLESKERI